MAFRTKPDVTAIWASLGDNTKPVDSYITNGWEAVKPPRQYFNWLDNRQDSAIAYLWQAGIVEWDALTDYEGGAGNTSYVQGSDGLVYKALADSGPNISGTGTKNPTVQPGNAAFWSLAFASQADIDTVEADVATLETQMGDGSGVTNAATWRTALSVDSSAQVDAKIDAALGSLLVAVASGTVTGSTKGVDLLSNITIDSYSKNITNNTATWDVSISGLANVLTSSNFIVNANGHNITMGIATYVDGNTFTITGFYPDNGADAYDLSMSFTVFMQG